MTQIKDKSNNRIKNWLGSGRLCPRCALENIKTRLKRLPNNLLSCPIGHWVGKEVGGKLKETLNCPRCVLEGVKVELKEVPNHLLACDRCQGIFRLVNEQLIQVLL